MRKHIQRNENMITTLNQAGYSFRLINVSNESGFHDHPNDSGLLRQYFDLRRKSYEEDKAMHGHFNEGKPDCYDFMSSHMLGLKDGTVIGGGRLTFSTPERMPLPSEAPKFKFSYIYPEVDLHNLSYGEIHRFVVASKYRNVSFFTLGLFWCIVLELAKYSTYWFAPSIPVKARLYRRIARKLGLDLFICKGLAFVREKYSNIELDLMVVNSEQGATKLLKESKYPHCNNLYSVTNTSVSQSLYELPDVC